jgi:alcohol dehydrogenase, propanol-preferring
VAAYLATSFLYRTNDTSRGPGAHQSGKDKERLARELGADEYLDTQASDPAQELLRMGGARVVMTTAPSGRAIASTIGGIGINGQLLVVAGPTDATDLYLGSLTEGNRSIQGWTSGTAVDSELNRLSMWEA